MYNGWKEAVNRSFGWTKVVETDEDEFVA
jgi:hypothetical protein